MPPEACAKNIITVGAIDDIPNGYQNTGDVTQNGTSSSNWGPTDDGRIKPDIVANGEGLYSPVYHNPNNPNQTGNSYYDYKSGTSMAAPSVTGSIALLMEHYRDTHSQNDMKSATVKALLIHTADEAGDSPGPDYKYG